MPENIVQYKSIQKEPELEYLNKGIFRFKGIEFNISEAKFLADSIGNILTGKSFLVSKHIEMLDNESLKDSISTRLHILFVFDSFGFSSDIQEINLEELNQYVLKAKGEENNRE